MPKNKKWLPYSFFVLMLQLSVFTNDATATDGIIIGKPDAPNNMKIMFSIGCSHCLDFMNSYLGAMEDLIQDEQLSAEFIEIPGIIAPGDNPNASKRAIHASFALYCVEQKKPEYYLSTIKAAIRSALRNVLSFNGWQNWVHAKDVVIRGGVDKNFFLKTDILSFAGIPIEECDVEGFKNAASQRNQLAKDGNIAEVPHLEYNGAIFEGSESIEDMMLKLPLSAKRQFILGRLFHEGGKGISSDEKLSAKWYRKAAKQGHPEAQAHLGLLYEKGIGVAEDIQESIKWYLKAAEQGHPGAQVSLGFFYGYGRGVPKDSLEAIKWYRKAADQSYPPGQFSLALMYEAGNGVPKDIVVAKHWLHKAAERDYVEAKLFLAEIYEKEENYSEAIKLYVEAARAGNFRGQYKAGLYLFEGRVLSKNYIDAYRWTSLAAEKNYPKAKELLVKLKSVMTPAQIEEASTPANN